MFMVLHRRALVPATPQKLTMPDQGYIFFAGGVSYGPARILQINRMLAQFPQRVALPRAYGLGGLAQTLFFNVCALPKASFAEGCEEMPRPPPWSLRQIADSKLRSLRQPP